MRDTQGAVMEDRVGGLLADAAEFFQVYLWESPSGQAARDTLAGTNLDEDLIRDFGVGYAPIGPEELMGHLHGLGYSTEELVEAGMATRSVRGRAHAHFRSRVMFPVRDADGRILGFAGLGTHVGPSWALWITSPDVGLYRRSEAVFGLDRAARVVAASGTAVVQRDCVEVLRAHQEGRSHAVAVHTPWVTRDQMLALADGLPGGLDALEVQLPPGMTTDAKEEPTALTTLRDPASALPGPRAPDGESAVSHLKAKRL